MDRPRGARVEIPVRVDAFERAVEQQTDQLALGVEGGRAAIAAGDVEIGQEVDRDRADRVELVLAVILRLDQGEFARRSVERIDPGVLLGDPFESGEGQVFHPVEGRSAHHVAVSDAQRRIGIGIGQHALFRLPLRDRLHVGGAQGEAATGALLCFVFQPALVIVERDGELHEGIVARFQIGDAGIHQREPGLALVERGVGVVTVEDRIELLGIVDAGQAQGVVEHGDAFGLRLGEIAVEEQLPFGLVDARIIAAVERLQALTEERHVAFLIARLALGVGLLTLLGEAIEPLGDREQLRAGGVAVPEAGARRSGAFLREFGQIVDRRTIGRPRGIGGDPVGQRGFPLAATFDQADAARAFDLAAQVLLVIVEPGKACFVFDARIRSFGCGGFDGADPVGQQLLEGRIFPAEGVFDFGEHRVARGRAGIARDHHEIAFVEPALGDLQEVLGLVGHVVFGIFGRGAVGRDIGAVKAEIAGVTRPHPVIDVAAILADRIRRGVDEAHVLYFELLDELVFVAAVIARDPAAIAGFLLALCSDVLRPLIDRIVPLVGRHRVRACAHALGHVAEIGGHIDARARRGRQLGAHRLREEAVFEIVVLGGRIVLHRSARAVVVGNDQPLRRNEAGRAAAQADDRAHREAGEVAERFGIEFEAGLFQIVGNLGQLLRSEHPFLGGKRLDRDARHEGGHQKHLVTHLIPLKFPARDSAPMLQGHSLLALPGWRKGGAMSFVGQAGSFVRAPPLRKLPHQSCAVAKTVSIG